MNAANKVLMTNSCGMTGGMRHKKMKIAWLCSYPIHTIRSVPELIGVNGHPSTWVRNLSHAIQTYFPEVDLHVITETTRVRRDIFFEEGGVKFHVLRSGSSIPLLTKGWPAFMPLDVVTKYTQSCRKIIRVLDGISPDLVHAHGTESAYARAAILSRYPAIISMQGFITELKEYYASNLSFQLRSVLERAVLVRTKYFIAKTGFASELIRKRNKSAEIFEIPNAVHEAFLKQYSLPRISNSMLYVGSILPQKGVEFLVHSMVELEHVQLELVGGGRESYLRRLRRIINRLGLDVRVKISPSMSSEVIAEKMAQASVLVLPSLMENSPNVISEAMCIGLPVVASNVGGIPDMIRPGVTGTLIQSRDSSGIAKAVKAILADSANAEKMAHQARTEAIKKYYPRKVAEQTILAYEKILSRE